MANAMTKLNAVPQERESPAEEFHFERSRQHADHDQRRDERSNRSDICPLPEKGRRQGEGDEGRDENNGAEYGGYDDSRDPRIPADRTENELGGKERQDEADRPNDGYDGRGQGEKRSLKKPESLPRFSPVHSPRTEPGSFPQTPEITAVNMPSHLTCVARMAIFVRASMERVRFSFGTNTQLVGRTDTLCRRR